MRRSYSFIAFLLVVLCLHSELDAQAPPELINNSQFRPVARQAVDSLYNFNEEAAWQLLEPWRQKYPEHPMWILFKGIELWWQILSDLEDRSHDEQFYNLMGRADYESSQLLREEPSHADALIIKTISNGYVARQNANRDEWIASVNQSRKAYNAYQYLSETEPEFPDLKLAEGLKLYYSEFLPEEYPIVRTVSWFLPDGNKQEGLSLLAQAVDSSIFAKAEARYFLGNINLMYEEDYAEAAEHLAQLYEAYPNNSYYSRILVRSYYHMDNYDRALEVIDQALERWNKKRLPYENVLREELLTWKGRILFNQFRYNQAIPILKEAFETGSELPSPQHRSHHVISGYYLGRSYMETGNEEQARRYLELISGMDAQKEYRDHGLQLLEDEL